MGRYAKIAAKAAGKTNKALASELARHGALKAAELERLLPTKADKKHYARLVDIVNSQTSQNEKIAALRKNLNDLGGVLLKVVRKVT